MAITNPIFVDVAGNGFDPVTNVHFLADVFDVGAHGFKSDPQLIANLFV
jgi:hypothetical protein